MEPSTECPDEELLQPRGSIQRIKRGFPSRCRQWITAFKNTPANRLAMTPGTVVVRGAIFCSWTRDACPFRRLPL